MKYIKSRNIYSNSTGTNIYNCTTQKAHSYSWYCYYRVINGYRVFNTCAYSNTTAKHLQAFKRYVGAPIDIEIHAPCGLFNILRVVEYYKDEIEEIEKAINKKGSRKTTNIKRVETIKEYQNKLDFIKTNLIEKGD